jgi:hypothetical protein
MSNPAFFVTPPKITHDALPSKSAILAAVTKSG